LVSDFEELKMRLFEKEVARRIFGPNTEEATGGWRNYIIRSFIIFTSYQILLG
jgi:hypothetical protein